MSGECVSGVRLLPRRHQRGREDWLPAYLVGSCRIRARCERHCRSAVCSLQSASPHLVTSKLRVRPDLLGTSRAKGAPRNTQWPARRPAGPRPNFPCRTSVNPWCRHRRWPAHRETPPRRVGPLRLCVSASLQGPAWPRHHARPVADPTHWLPPGRRCQATAAVKSAAAAADLATRDEGEKKSTPVCAGVQGRQSGRVEHRGC